MEQGTSAQDAYEGVREALQRLANATGQAWIVTNVQLDPAGGPAEPAGEFAPDQPCLLCGQIH